MTPLCSIVFGVLFLSKVYLMLYELISMSSSWRIDIRLIRYKSHGFSSSLNHQDKASLFKLFASSRQRPPGCPDVVVKLTPVRASDVPRSMRQHSEGHSKSSQLLKHRPHATMSPRRSAGPRRGGGGWDIFSGSRSFLLHRINRELERWHSRQWNWQLRPDGLWSGIHLLSEKVSCQSGSPSRRCCQFQGCDHGERADSDFGFESAARVHRHRSGPVRDSTRGHTSTSTRTSIFTSVTVLSRKEQVLLPGGKTWQSCPPPAPVVPVIRSKTFLSLGIGASASDCLIVVTNVRSLAYDLASLIWMEISLILVTLLTHTLFIGGVPGVSVKKDKKLSSVSADGRGDYPSRSAPLVGTCQRVGRRSKFRSCQRRWRDVEGRPLICKDNYWAPACAHEEPDSY